MKNITHYTIIYLFIFIYLMMKQKIETSQQYIITFIFRQSRQPLNLFRFKNNNNNNK